MSEVNSNNKKAIIYVILSLLTILILIITNGVLYNVYKNSKDETHLVEGKYESIANLTDKKYEAVVDSFEKKFEVLVNSFKNKYELIVNSLAKNNESEKNLSEEKYKSMINLFEKKLEAVVNLFETKFELMANSSAKNNELTANLSDEKYSLMVDSFQKKLEAFVNSFENKYELMVNLSTENNEPFAEAFEKYSIDDESDLDTKNSTLISYIGKNIILKCINTKNSISIANLWYHNDAEIDVSDLTKYKLQNGNLKIKNLNENDEGSYRCHSTDNHINKTIFYDLFVQYDYKWTDPNSVDSENPVYMKVNTNEYSSVGRADYDSHLLPGTAYCGYGNRIYFAINDHVHEAKDFEILMINKNINYLWIEASDGMVPKNSLKGGYTADGETLYIGRHYVGNDLLSGMIQPSAKCLSIANAVKEYRFPDYEVLVILNLNQ